MQEIFPLNIRFKILSRHFPERFLDCQKIGFSNLFNRNQDDSQSNSMICNKYLNSGKIVVNHPKSFCKPYFVNWMGIPGSATISRSAHLTWKRYPPSPQEGVRGLLSSLSPSELISNLGGGAVFPLTKYGKANRLHCL